MKQEDSGQKLKGVDDEAKREAARLLGSITTERKRASSAANIAKARNMNGPPLKKLSEIACTCTAGDASEHTAHRSYCLRGAAVRRRQKKGAPLE
jgi:hypothetical protein